MDVCPPGLLVGWVRRGRGPDTPDGLGARDRARGLGASDGRGDNRDRCPLANARTQLEDGADLFRPDAHAREAEMAGRDTGPQLILTTWPPFLHSFGLRPPAGAMLQFET